MTQYILVGGYDSRAMDQGRALCKAMASGSDQPHILSCFFAEPDQSQWQEKFNRKGRQLIANFLPEATIELAEPAHFLEQVMRADVLYLHGGSDDSLVRMLDSYPPLSVLCSGKTVVGSSSGAAYLSTVYWTCDDRMIRRGKGFTPLAVMSHYQSPDYGANDLRGPIDWGTAKAELEAAAGNLPVHCLREGEFVVIEQ